MPGTENNNQVGGTEDKTQENQGLLTEDAVRKLIQSETDKVRSEYTKRMKALESEKLTAEERFQLEKRDFDLARKEWEINQKITTSGHDPRLTRLVLNMDDPEDGLRIVQTVIQEQVEKALKERIKSSTPKSGDPIGQGSFSSMSTEEILKTIPRR